MDSKRQEAIEKWIKMNGITKVPSPHERGPLSEQSPEEVMELLKDAPSLKRNRMSRKTRVVKPK